MTANRSEAPPPRAWIDRLVDVEPRVPWMAPYMAYLVLLVVTDLAPRSFLWLAMLVHTLVALWLTWRLRAYLHPRGEAHWPLAVGVGLLAAGLWVVGHHLLKGIWVGEYNLASRVPYYPGEARVIDPRAEVGSGAAFVLYASMKIGRAVLAVPIVEELFWRGFILRAFAWRRLNWSEVVRAWDRFAEAPWGRFSWGGMVGSAMLSTAQHPDQWGVSIACWVLYNGLFYWTKSLKCLVLTHAVTNLGLYLYVLKSGDWQFW